MNIWEEFDKSIDTEGLQEDLKNVDTNGGGEFKEVPLGNYEVSIEKLELGKSKSGGPKLSGWFKILDGEYKNSMLFMSQGLSAAFGIHMAMDFVRSLDTDAAREIKFTTFGVLHNDLTKVLAEIKNDNLEYEIEMTESKGFKNYKILQVFGD